MGTGLVHCAPAHGAEDYAVFKQLKLLCSNDPDSLICNINDDNGHFSDSVSDVVGSEVCSKLAGQPVLNGEADAIIEVLEGMSSVPLKEERIKHRHPHDSKTNKPVIVT